MLLSIKDENIGLQEGNMVKTPKKALGSQKYSFNYSHKEDYHLSSRHETPTMVKGEIPDFLNLKSNSSAQNKGKMRESFHLLIPEVPKLGV